MEDDTAQRELVTRVLEDIGTVLQASTVEEARLFAAAVDLIICDWSLPDGSARDLQRGIGKPIVVVSGYEAPPDGEPAPGPWLRKPLHLDELRAAVTTAIARAGE